MKKIIFIFLIMIFAINTFSYTDENILKVMKLLVRYLDPRINDTLCEEIVKQPNIQFAFFENDQTIPIDSQYIKIVNKSRKVAEINALSLRMYFIEGMLNGKNTNQIIAGFWGEIKDTIHWREYE